MTTRDAAAPIATGPLPPGVAVAVTPHSLASETAIDTMRSGGNAVDAAVAANAVLGVVLPDTCGVGGDLFAIVHETGEAAPLALNASGRAGSGASAQRLRDAGYSAVPLRSVDSITVPGCVDGWEALADRFATRPLVQNLSPAINHAAGGFPVSVELAGSLERLRPTIGAQPSAASLYPEGETPRAGEVITRPALADTLAAVASGGRAAFYEGPVGLAITEVTGGIITDEDLRRRQAAWVDPLSTDIMGLTAWTVPPNSQGWVTLATLRLFEMLDPPKDPLDPGYHHALIEAYRAVVWERADVTSDPDTLPIQPAELIDEDRLAERADSIDQGATQRWPAAQRAPSGTAYLATRDSTGMAVSLIQSNFRGIGTGLSAGASGVWLHDRGEGFDLRSGHPNELAPGRRPLHTLAPTLWTNGNDTALVLGTRGGDGQPQYAAQVAAHHRWADLCVEDAQLQPRWAIPDIADPNAPVQTESRFARGTVAGLAQRGHQIEDASSWEVGWGPVSAISVQPAEVRGAADPRVSTAAALWE